MTGTTTQRPPGIPNQVITVLQHLVNDAATRFLALALETELRAFLVTHGGAKLQDGSQAVVRNGYLPPRVLRTSVGGIRVRVPRPRDRSLEGIATFTSALIPPYHARSRLDARLPEAYLQSVLFQDPELFLEVLLGSHIHDLPTALTASIQEQWASQWRSWGERSLATSMHLCWWVGLTPLTTRNAPGDATQHLAFIVGLYEDGRHELVHVARSSGDIENEWLEILTQLRRRGLRKGPQLTHAQQTPVFLRTLLQVFPDTLIASEPWGGGRERPDPSLRVI